MNSFNEEIKALLERTVKRSGKAASRFANHHPKHIIMFIVLGITTVIFWPDLTHFFAIDDFVWIWTGKYNMSDVHSWIYAFTHINGSGQYRPLSQQVFFWLCYHLFGLDPFGYHIINFVVFLLTCWFLYRMLLKLTSSTVIATSMAALFCFSSIHFEHIYWVAAFTETLGTLCVVLSLYEVVKGQQTWAVIWYIIGLGANETVIILPLLAISYYLLFEKMSIKQALRATYRYWVVLIVYLLLRMTVFGGLGAKAKGAFAIVWSPIVWINETIHSFLVALNLNVELKNIFLSTHHWKWAITASCALGLGILIFALISNHSKIGYRWRLIILGCVWFVIGLLPVLPFANNFADYTISIPLLGLPLIVIGIIGDTKPTYLYPLFTLCILSLSLIAMYGPNGLYHVDGYRTLSSSDEFAFIQMESVKEKMPGPLIVNIIGPSQAMAVLGGQWTAKTIANNSQTILGTTSNANLTLLYQPTTLSFVVK